MKKKIEALLNYLASSPSPWHLCDTTASLLKSKGWEELNETKDWSLKRGKSYFLKKNGSAIFGFRLPKEPIASSCIFAAHTDSPALKLKPHAERIVDNMVVWGLSIYGGPILQSWWNKELIPSGLVSYLDKKGQLKHQLVHLESCPVVLAQLSIHLHENPPHKGLSFHKEDEALALVGHPFNKNEKISHLEVILQKELGFKKLISHDLFLVPKEKPSVWGVNQEGIAAYRLDNLASCHAIIDSFLNRTGSTKGNLEVFYFADHEEIGSSTAQGADSPFLLDCLKRIYTASEGSEEGFYPFKAKSTCFSLDVAHAKHPTQPTRTDAHHLTLFGGGIALKNSALQRYASDEMLSAWLKSTCIKHKIDLQDFIMRNDVPSGSTIGPIIASKTGIRTLDLGHPLLSMHASRELISSDDHLMMCKLVAQILKEPPKTGV